MSTAYLCRQILEFCLERRVYKNKTSFLYLHSYYDSRPEFKHKMLPSTNHT